MFIASIQMLASADSCKRGSRVLAEMGAPAVVVPGEAVLSVADCSLDVAPDLVGWDVRAPGELRRLGNYASQIRALELLVESQEHYGLILEDRAVLADSPQWFSALLRSWEATMRAHDADVMQLVCYDRHFPTRYNLPPSRVVAEYADCVRVSPRTFPSTAMIYSCHMAAHIVEAHRVIRAPWDVTLQRMSEDSRLVFLESKDRVFTRYEDPV